MISQICEARSSHAATSSFQAALRPPNDIKDLSGTKTVSLPCSLSILPARVQGDMKQAHLIPSCKGWSSVPAARAACRHAGAAAVALPQSRRSPPRLMVEGKGRERTRGKGRGQRQGLGHRSVMRWQGHRVCWVGWKLSSDQREVPGGSHTPAFCPPQGCPRGQQQARGAQGISRPTRVWGHALHSPVSQPQQCCPGRLQQQVC